MNPERRVPRAAKPHRFEVPSRTDILTRLDALVHDHTAAARASQHDWAAEYVLFDDRQVYPTISDPVVREGILLLLGCDAEVSPGESLHGRTDFIAWRDAMAARLSGP